MTAEQLAGPEFRAEVLRRVPTGQVWLDELPARFGRLVTAWRLEQMAPARAGRTSVVVPVRSGGRAAAVKLVGPAADARAEATALTAFEGRGAVGLYDADLGEQALLLEWLDGPSLDTVPDAETAVRAAADVAARLASVPAPPGTPTLADQARGWNEQLRAQHAQADSSGTALPDEVVARALAAVDRLRTDRSATLTHGDLSLGNVLSGRRSPEWVAIDPLLVRGPVAFEAHTVVRSRLADLARLADPIAAHARLVDLYADATGTDAAWTHALSGARYASSYYWESQHGGEPGDVRRLRWMTARS